MIDRFILMQETEYDRALNEIKKGCKQTHWIWYIWPQLDGLVSYPSYYTKYYAIKDFNEAIEYYHNRYLHDHLIEITTVLYNLPTSDINTVLSTVDCFKLRSCMTLFNLVQDDTDLFSKVLDKYFMSNICENTIDLIKKES